MTTTRLRITHAGPHVSYQDGGRHGLVGQGISVSGALDRASLAEACAAPAPEDRYEAAHLAAQALVSRGRESEDPVVHDRLVRLTDEQGLDGIAEMWAEAPAVSLPGALWRLYALRAAARDDMRAAGVSLA